MPAARVAQHRLARRSHLLALVPERHVRQADERAAAHRQVVIRKLDRKRVLRVERQGAREQDVEDRHKRQVLLGRQLDDEAAEEQAQDAEGLADEQMKLVQRLRLGKVCVVEELRAEQELRGEEPVEGGGKLRQRRGVELRLQDLRHVRVQVRGDEQGDLSSYGRAGVRGYAVLFRSS